MQHWLSVGFVAETDQLVELARIAEAAGFFGVTVPDHLVMPTRFESAYPYAPGGATFWPVENPWPDPWVAIGAMAGATTTLRFASNIYLGALRDPFTAAKAIATASVLSGGRVACGLSAGWLREEFDLVGVDFASRGRRLDELIGVLRRLWSGDPVAHQGDHYAFEEVIVRPAPASPVPIWTGGHSAPALRRAARHADGWLGLVYAPDELASKLARLQALREEAGRAKEPFDVLCGLAARPTPELVGDLAAHGVTGLICTPWFGRREDISSLDAKRRLVERYAERVIHA